MDKGKISIVTPTFNRAHLIEKAISSVIGQSYKEWELIIVDDGSTDNTNEVIKKYLDDHRINYYKIPNGGVSGARNFGVSKSGGEFLLFLDSDDEIHQDKLALHMELFANNSDLDVTVSQVLRKKLKTGITKKHTKIKPSKNIQTEFIRKDLAWKIHSPIWKKDFLLKEKGFNEDLRSSEDFEFYARLVLQNPKVGYIPSLLSIINDYQQSHDKFKLRSGQYDLDSLKNHLMSRNLIGFSTFHSNLSLLIKLKIYSILIKHWAYCMKKSLYLSFNCFYKLMIWYCVESMPSSFKKNII